MSIVIAAMMVKSTCSGCEPVVDDRVKCNPADAKSR